MRKWFVFTVGILGVIALTKLHIELGKDALIEEGFELDFDY